MSKYEELSKLKELLDAGILSKEEFETKKKKILSGVGNMTPKKSKKYLVAIIIAIMAILVIGGYYYYGGEATLADFSYKESVYGITIGKDYESVFEKASNDEDSKKRVMGLVITEDKSEIGLSHKDYRGVVFDGVNFHFSSGVVSSIELRKTANHYDGDAAQIINEAYNSVESSLRRDYSSCQETDEGVVFFNEYEKITIHQEEDFYGQCELNVKIEKK